MEIVMTDKKSEKVEVKVEVKEKTAAQKIWEEIKGVQIDMFTLPNQFVEQHCFPQTIEPTKCYLVSRASSILPALEAALGSKYFVTQEGRFVVVSHATGAVSPTNR
jgi:hypothetical protein